MKSRQFCRPQWLGVAAIIASAPLMPGPGARAVDAKPATPPAAPIQKKLTGAELYAIHCTRCHTGRTAPEFTANQWQTILTHMRVRATLPAKQAREILKYLQAEAGD